MVKAVFIDYMGTTVDERSPEMAEQIGLTDEPSALFDLIHGHWVNAPVFPDARTFFGQCPAPIYIITNNGLPYWRRRWSCFSSNRRPPPLAPKIGSCYHEEQEESRRSGCA